MFYHCITIFISIPFISVFFVFVSLPYSFVFILKSHKRNADNHLLYLEITKECLIIYKHVCSIENRDLCKVKVYISSFYFHCLFRE